MQALGLKSSLMSNYHFVSECPGTANEGLTFVLYKMELSGTFKNTETFRLAMPHMIDVFRNHKYQQQQRHKSAVPFERRNSGDVENCPVYNPGSHDTGHSY